MEMNGRRWEMRYIFSSTRETARNTNLQFCRQLRSVPDSARKDYDSQAMVWMSWVKQELKLSARATQRLEVQGITPDSD